MSMKSLSTLGVREEAPGGLSCLMDSCEGWREEERGESGIYFRSRPDVYLLTTATGQWGV